MSDGRYLALVGELAPRPNGAGTRSAGAGHAPVDAERLTAALASLNLEIAGSLAARFAPAGASGFQALLHRPGAAVDAVVALEEELPGLPLRLGLGWGELSGAPRVTARGAAGPCLDAARRALARGRDQGRWATAQGWGVRRDKVLNGLLGLLGALRGGWTARQAEIVACARRSSTQKEAAAALAVRPSVVSEALAAAGYRRTLEGEEALRQLLEIFGEG